MAADGELLILIPLRDTLVFPGTVIPLGISRPMNVRAVEEAVNTPQPVGLFTQRKDVERPGADDIYTTGTLAEVIRLAAPPDGQYQITLRARQRIRIRSIVQTEPFFLAKVERLAPTAPDTPEFRARVRLLREQAMHAISLLPQPTPELTKLSEQLQGIDDAALLTDLVAASLDLPLDEKQAVLEAIELEPRVQLVLTMLSRQIEILELSQKISAETRSALDREQREYFLREQLRTIRRELGEDDARSAEAEELRHKIAAARMPQEVERHAERELAHLSRIPDTSSEYSMLRAYLDWLVELPWSISVEATIDVRRARAILDEDHYDLDKVKRRIIELLAVRKLNPDGKSPILCFVGPPGVGKTSLGLSIARATGRRFVRHSLGGVHDEAAIRGHRRSYVGAQPGRLIQGIRRAGSRNPVFMLDEVDKLGSSNQGDPAAALLEVLDPEQNFAFEDHYLGVPFDLRQVLFICTANVLYDIPKALRDRMEIIELLGYTEEEKLAIARRYLIPRQLAQSGLTDSQLRIEDQTVREVIRSYTRESGLRQLERQLGALCRAVAVAVAQGDAGPFAIGPSELRSRLGIPRHLSEAALQTSLPGVATGLAWTASGGDILFVEATRTDGDGRLLLTGQLGDVMRESALAALTLIKAQAPELGIDPRLLRKSDIHLHIPAGAIPKDGPSAGVAIFVALVSRLLGQRVRRDVAMTGEISLRGLVLPVGAIKEKVLAARRAGIARVLLPALNRDEFEEDLSAEVRSALDVRFLNTVSEALELALEETAAAKTREPPAGADGDGRAVAPPDSRSRRPKRERQAARGPEKPDRLLTDS
jgi:ATP-dependent Lon protease